MKLLNIPRGIFWGILILSLAAIAFGQDYRGKVQGSVMDESGGVIPGTKVVLRNESTKVEVTTTTNDDGRYKFDFVEPGNYSVIAEKDGFKKVLQQGLVVQI
ncbi:MAG: carboxypeptidase-like regulatory domain-containing protein, partial [Acidobacteriota bacterium]